MSGSGSLQAGQYHQHYLVLATLGTGGMSEVYLGYDFQAARLVALKRLAAPLAESERVLRSFLREGELLLRLRHPSILRIHELSRDDDGTAQMVLEYVHGLHVGRLLRRPGPVPVRTAVRILEDAAGGLGNAHRQGVVHRDVKPQNIIWKPQGRAVVIDFGIAQSDRPDEVDANLDALGTLAYASPEQRQGEPVDARTDVWSLGAVAYELLTGRRATPLGSRQEMLRSRSDDLPHLRELRPEVPGPLAELVTAMLEDYREERLESLTRVLVELGKMRASMDESLRELCFGTEIDRQLDLAFWSWDQGEGVRAREILGEVVRAVGPRDPARVHQLRARFAEQEGRPEVAREEYRKALDYAPEAVDLYLEHATLLLRMAKFDLLEELLESVPPGLRKAGPIVVLQNVQRQLPLVPPEVLERFGFQGVAVQLQRGISRRTETSPGGTPERRAGEVVTVPEGTFEEAQGFSTSPKRPTDHSGADGDP